MAVVTFGSIAEEGILTGGTRIYNLLKLDNHVMQDGVYFSVYTSANSDDRIRCHVPSAWQHSPGTDAIVDGATPTQRGIYAGAYALLSNTDKTILIGGKNVTRQPVMVLFTDGEPTWGYDDYRFVSAPTDPTAVLTNNRGYGDTAEMGIDILTVLTASYFKQKVTDHYYGTVNPAGAVKFFTIGVNKDKESNKHIGAVLDPINNAKNVFSSQSGWSDTSMKDRLDRFMSRGDSSFPAYQLNSNNLTMLTVTNYDNYIKSYDYTDGYYHSNDNVKELSDAFNSVVEQVIDYSHVAPTEKPLIYVDVLGEYMDFRRFEGIWYNTQAGVAKSQVIPSGTGAYGDFTLARYVAANSVLAGMQIEVYTATKDGARFTDPDRSNIMPQSLMQGQQVVRWVIPSNLIPLCTMSSTGEVTKNAPTQLVFAVGLGEAGMDLDFVNEASKNKHQVSNAGGNPKYWFETNADADTIVTFEPNTSNPYYQYVGGIFIEHLDNNGKIEIQESLPPQEQDTNKVVDPLSPPPPIKDSSYAGKASGEGLAIGDVITYTITHENTLDTDLDVKISDSAPVGTDYVAGSAQGTYGPANQPITPTIDAGGVITWGFVTLKAGETMTVSFRAVVTEAARDMSEIENTAQYTIGQNNPSKDTNKVIDPLKPFTPSLTLKKTVEGDLFQEWLAGNFGSGDWAEIVAGMKFYAYAVSGKGAPYSGTPFAEGSIDTDGNIMFSDDFPAGWYAIVEVLSGRAADIFETPDPLYIYVGSDGTPSAFNYEADYFVSWYWFNGYGHVTVDSKYSEIPVFGKDLRDIWNIRARTYFNGNYVAYNSFCAYGWSNTFAETERYIIRNDLLTAEKRDNIVAALNYINNNYGSLDGWQGSGWSGVSVHGSTKIIAQVVVWMLMHDEIEYININQFITVNGVVINVGNAAQDFDDAILDVLNNYAGSTGAVTDIAYMVSDNYPHDVLSHQPQIIPVLGTTDFNNTLK